ncbi:hypothetical protein [Arthrobacter sp. Y81]|uniref:hypothetical protein n=1 Tax=Arthrobacter sp. Y81 TaxID=2058897 RepID=UPI0028006EAB|nr:hypothetical protein [Arthrobacter sp. Y81]
MASHYTRFLNWMTPGGAEAYYERVGTPIDSHVPPVHAGHKRSAQEQAEVGAEFGISFPNVERVAPSFQQDAGLPAAQSPYFLSAGEGEGEGEGLVSYQTMFTYLSRPANTGSNYFAVHTKGAKSPYIPLHFHEDHTENFLCTEGRMWLYANGREVLLTKGDFPLLRVLQQAHRRLHVRRRRSALHGHGRVRTRPGRDGPHGGRSPAATACGAGHLGRQTNNNGPESFPLGVRSTVCMWNGAGSSLLRKTPVWWSSE